MVTLIVPSKIGGAPLMVISNVGGEVVVPEELFSPEHIGEESLKSYILLLSSNRLSIKGEQLQPISRRNLRLIGKALDRAYKVRTGKSLLPKRF